MASPYTPNVLILQGRNYVVQTMLGEGAFGKVYKVRDGGSGSVYALKQIEVENNEAVNMVKREFGILAKCSHAHIVRLFDVDFEQSSVLMLMEYCEGGNLNSRLNRPSESETNLRWMKELGYAMCYLHSNNIVHRDLKPENVLLTVNESIKLGDFGLAREYAALKQGRATKSDEVLVSYLNTVYMGTKAGSPYWMAPEVFDGQYTEKADIFSLGTIFYSIVKRKYLIVGGSKYFGAFVTIGGQQNSLGIAMKSNRNVMVPLDGLQRSERELLQEMLDYYPSNRPSAKEVLEKL